MAKKETYVIIPDWMYDLGLDLREITIYATIYGFSQDGKSSYDGGQAYLMRRACCTKPTLIKCLEHLISLGYIRKARRAHGGCSYTAVLPDEPECTSDAGKETLPQGKEILPSGKETLPKGKEILPPSENKYKNNSKINLKNTPASGDADATASGDAEDLNAEFETLWSMYPRKQGKAEARRAYVAARRSGTSYQTVRAGVEAYNAKIKAEQPLMRYVIHGGNWFEGRRWEDDDPPDGGTGAPLRTRKQNRALDYKQHRYTAEELRARGIDLGEDVYEEEKDA